MTREEALELWQETQQIFLGSVSNADSDFVRGMAASEFQMRANTLIMKMAEQLPEDE